MNLNRKIKKVLYIVENEENAQFRYRCYNVFLATNSSSEWRVKWCLKNEMDSMVKELDSFDLVVISRQIDKDGALGRFIKKVHKAGKKVLFDLDDLVFDYRYLKVLMQSTDSKNIFYWLGYFWGIRRIARKVDGFLVTNDFLGRKMEQSFKKPYKVIRNSLNKSQIEVSNGCLATKKHDGFRIGYFSGSPTHAKDFRMVEPEIIRFLEEHGDAKMMVVGYMNFSSEMKKLIDAERVVVKKIVNYLELQKLLSKVDVNIAPLLINDFTNCKSELKFFEAAAVETITIASPTYAFKAIIENGKNGFLALPGEWYDRLRYLYENPKKSLKMAKSAKSYALGKYYGEDFLKEVESAYDYFTK